jgi:diguanylate cyclase (GGDEF)-like protein/PAS domain S-box-containing protein
MGQIRTRLLLVWGIIALLTLRELLGMPETVKGVEQNARIQLRMLGMSGLQLFDSTLTATDRALQSTVEAISLIQTRGGALNSDMTKAMLERHQAMVPGIEGIAVVDAAGKIIASSITPSVNSPLSERSYFRALLSAPSAIGPTPPVLSQTLPSPFSGQPALNVARRMTGEDGQFAGIVVASINVEHHFGHLLNKLQPTPTTRLALLDEDMRVLFIWPYAPEHLGKHVPKLSVFSESAQDATVYDLDGVDGFRRLAMKFRLTSFPVFFAVSEHQNTFLAPWKLSRDKSILFLIVMLTAGGLLTLAIWRDHQSKARERLSQSVFLSAQEGIVITGPDARIIDANPRMAELTGYMHDEMVGQKTSLFRSGRQDAAFYRDLWETLQHKDEWRGDIWNQRKDGSLYVQNTSITAVRDPAGRLTYYAALCSDVTQQRHHTEELEAKLNQDALTGLPNRLLLDDRLQLGLAQARRERSLLAVCFIDLDDFKPINDTYGHRAGDQVLIEIAHRLQQSIRGGDTAARLGGDEFILLLTNLANADECRQGVERLLSAITQPIVTDSGRVQVSASIGIALFPRDAQNGDELILMADQAMYNAKNTGRNRYSEYT